MNVNGMVCGVPMVGDCVEQDKKDVIAVIETLNDLKKRLTGLFNEQIANAVMEKLGTTKVAFNEGKTPTAMTEALDTLTNMGLIHKSKNHAETEKKEPQTFGDMLREQMILRETQAEVPVQIPEMIEVYLILG